jgi:predicted small lipoprotein YifL
MNYKNPLAQILTIALMCSLVACGHKAPPVPPQDKKPPAPGTTPAPAQGAKPPETDIKPPVK